MKNVLIVVIDALRYDIMSDPEQRRLLAPNVDRLVHDGTLMRVVANAGTTQFVLPALLSQSYPLDYGGYDEGIRARPASFVERFRDTGYHTVLATSCNQYGLAHGYDRGFQRVRGLYSASGQLRRLAFRKLEHEIELWESGEQSQAALIEVVRTELGALLEKLAEEGAEPPAVGVGWRDAARHNRMIALGCTHELGLLEHEPMVVIEKLRSLGGAYYWTALGLRLPGPRRRLVQVLSYIKMRMGEIAAPTGLQIPKYAAYQFPVEEVEREVPRMLGEGSTPWLAYLHVMDVHSYFFYRGLRDLAVKARFLPRLRALRRLGRPPRPAFHDLSLMQVDAAIGRLLDQLESIGQREETIVAVMGDHGKNIESVDARAKQPVALRTHREHLETAFVLAGGPNPAPGDGLLDSMSVAATLLEAAGIDGHPSFKGVSAYAGGKDFVVSENAGAGSADLERKDLYFTVTGRRHKLMTVLRGARLDVHALFDLEVDPQERVDVQADPTHACERDRLIQVLFEERREVFELRGVSNPLAFDGEMSPARASQ